MNRYMSPSAAVSSCRHAILGLLLAGFTLPGAAQTLDQRKQAVRTTITNNSAVGKACNINFYWEIGDQNGKLDGAVKGTGNNPATDIQIYSAGKWLYGAYVFQKRGGQLTTADKDALRMQSGYNQSNACLFSNTVSACQGLMNTYTAAADTNNQYYYAGGHFQKHATTTLGMGSKTKPQMVTEMQTYLNTPDGADTNVAFSLATPVMASGYKTSPTKYAVFLRKILSGTLLLSGGALGSEAVCTYTGATNVQTGRSNCPGALYSPLAPPPVGSVEVATGADEDWDYSIGHWVETDPVVGDGAYSSPGAAGFYPWIDASRSWYGLISRNVLTASSSVESVYCGRLLRKAWITGIAQ